MSNDAIVSLRSDTAEAPAAKRDAPREQPQQPSRERLRFGFIRERYDTAVTDFVQTIGLLVRRPRAAGGCMTRPGHKRSKRLATDGPATTADLARAEGMKPQPMGTTIAALEEMGMTC